MTRNENGSPPKRRRIEDFAFTPQNPSPLTGDYQTHPLLTGSLHQHDYELELVLQAYFSHIHPWIPMIHEGRLRRRLSSDHESHRVGIVVRAMVLVAAKYVQDADVASALMQSPEQAERSRDEIVATAMKQLSAESSQALIMIAFDDVSFHSILSSVALGASGID